MYLCFYFLSDQCCSAWYSSPAPSPPSWWTAAVWAPPTPALHCLPATRRSSHSWCSRLETQKPSKVSEKLYTCKSRPNLSSNRTLTAFQLHGTGLDVHWEVLQIHGAGEDEGQPKGAIWNCKMWWVDKTQLNVCLARNKSFSRPTNPQLALFCVAVSVFCSCAVCVIASDIRHHVGFPPADSHHTFITATHCLWDASRLGGPHLTSSYLMNGESGLTTFSSVKLTRSAFTPEHCSAQPKSIRLRRRWCRENGMLCLIGTMLK